MIDDVSTHIDTLDARIHGHLRSLRVMILVCVATVVLVVAGQNDEIAKITGVPKLFIVGASCALLATWALAYFAFQRFGYGSRAYAVADVLEGAVFCANSLMYILLVPSPHNFGWLMHFLFVLHSSQSPKRRLRYDLFYAGVPALAALGYVVLDHNALAIVAAVYGAIVWQMQRTVQRSALDTATHLAARTKLEGEIRQLQIRAERSRIARDLHDGVAAELHALIWLIERGDEDRPDLADRLRAASDSLRDVVWGLSAAEKPWSEWVTDVRVRCRELCGDTLRLDFVYEEKSQGPISPQSQHALTRIMLEATRNAVRHSGGRALRIHLTREDNALALEVQDDGHGFSAPSLQSPRGLTNLRTRARELAGLCEFSNGGSGAHVRVALPAQRPAA